MIYSQQLEKSKNYLTRLKNEIDRVINYQSGFDYSTVVMYLVTYINDEIMVPKRRHLHNVNSNPITGLISWSESAINGREWSNNDVCVFMKPYISYALKQKFPTQLSENSNDIYNQLYLKINTMVDYLLTDLFIRSKDKVDQLKKKIGLYEDYIKIMSGLFLDLKNDLKQNSTISLSKLFIEAKKYIDEIVLHLIILIV